MIFLCIAFFLLGLSTAFCLIEVYWLKEKKHILVINVIALMFLLNKMPLKESSEMDVWVISFVLLVANLYYIFFRLPILLDLLKKSEHKKS